MAGSQHSGPVAARADLFRDRTWVITPHRRSTAVGRRRGQPSWPSRAVRTGVTMDVADHDAAVARVSHLPHLLSVLMAGHLTTVPEGDLRLAGQGLRDVTRVAASDPELWEQIVAANSAAVLTELRSVREQLDTFIAALDAGPVPADARPAGPPGPGCARQPPDPGQARRADARSTARSSSRSPTPRARSAASSPTSARRA